MIGFPALSFYKGSVYTIIWSLQVKLWFLKYDVLLIQSQMNMQHMCSIHRKIDVTFSLGMLYMRRLTSYLDSCGGCQVITHLSYRNWTLADTGLVMHFRFESTRIHAAMWYCWSRAASELCAGRWKNEICILHIDPSRFEVWMLEYLWDTGEGCCAPEMIVWTALCHPSHEGGHW